MPNGRVDQAGDCPRQSEESGIQTCGSCAVGVYEAFSTAVIGCCDRTRTCTQKRSAKSRPWTGVTARCTTSAIWGAATTATGIVWQLGAEDLQGRY
jgi:hypothetical protein